MHEPIDISLPLPLHVVGDVHHFHTFVDTFSYIPRSSELLLVDYYVLGNNGKAYSDHAIVYSPAHLGRNLEDTHDDQLWAFTQMLDQINKKYKSENGSDIPCQDFIDEYGTVFVRDRFLTSRKIHVTPTQVYDHWVATQQHNNIIQAVEHMGAKNSVKKM